MLSNGRTAIEAFCDDGESEGDGHFHTPAAPSSARISTSAGTAICHRMRRFGRERAEGGFGSARAR